MKSLYDEKYRYTKIAEDIAITTNDALRASFQGLVEEGFSPREIAQVMKAEIEMMMLESLL